MQKKKEKKEKKNCLEVFSYSEVRKVGKYRTGRKLLQEENSLVLLF